MWNSIQNKATFGHSEKFDGGVADSLFVCILWALIISIFN